MIKKIYCKIAYLGFILFRKWSNLVHTFSNYDFEAFILFSLPIGSCHLSNDGSHLDCWLSSLVKYQLSLIIVYTDMFWFKQSSNWLFEARKVFFKAFDMFNEKGLISMSQFNRDLILKSFSNVWYNNMSRKISFLYCSSIFDWVISKLWM